MDTNQVLTFPEPRAVELVDSERPDPETDQLLVETTRSVISTGTELTIMAGDFPDDSHWARYGTYPFETGYSAVGEVIEVGTEVDADWLGETVALGRPHGRYHAISPDAVTTVPDVPADEAAFFTLAGIAMNGVRRGRVRWGETIAVYGCGLIGQLAARFSHVAGARPVVAFDVASDRLEFLPDHPAIVGADPTVSDAPDTVRGAANGRLADAVFEVTGVPEAILDEFAVLREPLGRMVILSSPRGETSLDLHDYCNSPSYEIIGAHNGSHPPVETPQNPWTRDRHFELFFDLIEAGDLDVSGLISHRIAPDAAPDFYQRLLEDRSDVMGAVIEWT